MDISRYTDAAARAVPLMAAASGEERDAALLAIAAALDHECADVLAANAIDLDNAERNGVPPHMLDRLMLDERRVCDIAAGVRLVAALEFGANEVLSDAILKSGLRARCVRVPLGVVGMIYESRPNVTVDAAALTIKTGNCIIMRGGREALRSNIALAELMRRALVSVGLPADAAALIEDTTRDSAEALMKARGKIDLLIPRGGAGLIRAVTENATVPVIETGAGNCHVYVDGAADIKMAVEILANAKCQRPSVCNAAETVLVARSVAAEFLPLAKARLDEWNVEWRGDAAAREILPGTPAASGDDWMTEFNDYILACRVVEGVDEAIEHINRCGTRHSECIVTKDDEAAAMFLARVDAAAVYRNASTRFTDGFEFGLGAELGISTQKLHARGPMGLEALTSRKYIIEGTGQVRMP